MAASASAPGHPGPALWPPAAAGQRCAGLPDTVHFWYAWLLLIPAFFQRTAAGSVLEEIVAAGGFAVHPDVPACACSSHRAAHIVHGAQALGVPCFEDAVPVPQVALGPGLHGSFLHHGIVVAINLVPACNGLAPAKGQLVSGMFQKAADILLAALAQCQQFEVGIGLLTGLHALGAPHLQLMHHRRPWCCGRCWQRRRCTASRSPAQSPPAYKD